MKKRIGKIVLISLVSIVLLFLLLPFMAPGTEAPQGTKKANPQIFTSNPLTALVNRIAAVFQGKQKRLERKAALAQAQADAANAKLNELYASAQNAPAESRYSAAAPGTENGDTPRKTKTATGSSSARRPRKAPGAACTKLTRMMTLTSATSARNAPHATPLL